FRRENCLPIPYWECKTKTTPAKSAKYQKKEHDDQRAFLAFTALFSLRPLRSLRLRAFGVWSAHSTRYVSRHKRHSRSDGNPPGPRHASELPEVNLGAETQQHADHGAALGRLAREHTQQTDPKQCTIGDGGDLQA